MTVVVALILSLMYTVLKPVHERNADIFNKRVILMALGDNLGQNVEEMSDAQVLDIFNTKMEQVVIDSKGNPVNGLEASSIELKKEKKKPADKRYYPVYKFKNNDKEFIIVSILGKGLWDEISGVIAFESDMNTIAGAAFDHVGETPGMGAEIKDNPNFRAQFIGKTIFEGDEFKSIYLRKGGAKDPKHEIDMITGATLTCKGVNSMLKDGLGAYIPYFKENKNK